MKHLTIIRGTPGSGKSTLAKALFDAKIAAAICEADDFFHTAEGYKFDFSKLGQAHTVCQQQVAYLLGIGLSVIVSNTSTTWKEVRPYLDMALMHGATVSVITMETQFQNIHGVPEDKVQVMRNRMFDRHHFTETYKQVYGRPFDGDYLEHGKDDLCHTMQVLQSRTSSQEKSNTLATPKLTPA